MVAPFAPEKRFDLKHLAPIFVIDIKNDLPNLMTSFTKKLNQNSQGSRFTNQTVFSDHFLFNEDDQFVWTCN